MVGTLPFWQCTKRVTAVSCYLFAPCYVFLVDQSIHQGDIDFYFTRTSKELRSHEEIKCDRGILIPYSVLRQKSCSQNML